MDNGGDEFLNWRFWRTARRALAERLCHGFMDLSRELTKIRDAYFVPLRNFKESLRRFLEGGRKGNKINRIVYQFNEKKSARIWCASGRANGQSNRL